MRHRSAEPDATSIKLSTPKPTSEMLPAAVPAATAIRPSRLFQAIGPLTDGEIKAKVYVVPE